jgi:hypothetical protein
VGADAAASSSFILVSVVVVVIAFVVIASVVLVGDVDVRMMAMVPGEGETPVGVRQQAPRSNSLGNDEPNVVSDIRRVCRLFSFRESDYNRDSRTGGGVYSRYV